jgi:adenosylcobyric acid synthase
VTAKALMIQGTMSSAGKSLLVTALCRIFARRGVKVAPFKAQNMSNNAAVCADGSEIGRAQFTQAQAANIEPSVYMNPVLLKPESDMRSQVILMGRPWQRLAAQTYYEYKTTLWSRVTNALDYLRSNHELIIIEGAGSPAELNLKAGDIVNMAVARYAQSPVLLAGDIDRGGIFAQLLGTLWLLDAQERDLVKGLIVNKFRGDRALFDDGVHILEERGKVPVLGVLPYIHDLGIPDEDAATLENHTSLSNSNTIDIAVIHLPHIANFDDFDPLSAENGVSLRFVHTPDRIGNPHAIILPGTKSTIADLRWLRDCGLAEIIQQQAAKGISVVGICGGYQMLGQQIHDLDQVESDATRIDGLGLLPITTHFYAEKATHQAQAQISVDSGWLSEINGQIITGYEIHMGQTTSLNPWLHITKRSQQTVSIIDGAMSEDCCIWGCYLHGLFANENLRRVWLKSLGWQNKNIQPKTLDMAFDHLADVVEANLNMRRLVEIVGL